MTNELPELPDITPKVLREVAHRHGQEFVSLLPVQGISNAVYALGEHLVLRIPRDAAPFIEALYREVVAVPAARKAGVSTPELVDFDESCSLLPVPYAVFERVDGTPLEALGMNRAAPRALYELGCDLARLHSGVARTEESEIEDAFVGLDPREAVVELAERGCFTALEADGLVEMIERVTPPINQRFEESLRHGDLQATNVVVEPKTREYLAIIDWGSATWGDPAQDFCGLPLRHIPMLLEGYRSVSAMRDAEARILWWQLQNALYLLHRPRLTGLHRRAWAERPLAQLLEIWSFLISPQGEDWRNLVA